ncbi:DUF3307 domain-containing protein [Marivirga harenae]|uniref:DUF3307 domain-containing protein n=1 Tax=Marivirga harenae TaxID=2010992 RepID=UPI0026DF4C8C|nr:DUF3307 domain-containing protein [Marivirga harenae]WKV10997.1 DUF3307 domain-containing protein [Marivirga harenae]|tara:strand:- start:68824 stop:69540 length:717 start_codon:yes stop_codon:yes gene_type:complete
MISFLLKTLVAHVLGDFVFQPDHWIIDKQQKKAKSKFLYFHIIIHAAALLILLQLDSRYWLAFLIIPISHYLIDIIKINLEKSINSRFLFALDQIAHLSVIIGLGSFYYPELINFNFELSNNVLFLLLNILLITYGVAVLIKVIMSKWDLPEDSDSDSLSKAGKYIGMLERLFVFSFVLMAEWQAIGFLIAAKSVFRFGDLSRAKDRKLTEYILIGTLLSFGLAILVGFVYKNMLTLI